MGLGTLEVTNGAVDGGGTAGGIYAKFGDVTVANTEIANVVDGVVAGTDALVALGDGVAVDASGTAVKAEDGGAVSVTGGAYGGALDGADGEIAVTGGHFSEDPSAYVSEGYTTVPGDPDGYDVIARMADGLQIVVAEEGYVYNGAAQEGIASVDYGTTNLVVNTDYTVEYATNVNAGDDTATATLTGIGLYKGTKEATSFSIAKKPLTITADGATKKSSVSTSGEIGVSGQEFTLGTISYTQADAGNTYYYVVKEAALSEAEGWTIATNKYHVSV